MKHPAGPLHSRHLTDRMAQDIAILHSRCFDHPWSAKEFSNLLKATGIYGIGLFLSQRILAFCLIRVILDEAEILTLCVHPDYRQAGLGQKILAASEALASDLGIQRFFLEVSVRNEAALALYKKQGWNQEGLRRAYYRDGADAHILTKSL